jgi:hypothetical protein
MRTVELHGATRNVCARIEIPDVVPPFEFIRWRDRNFAWRDAEGIYVEATVFVARGEPVTERDRDLPKADSLPEEFQI